MAWLVQLVICQRNKSLVQFGVAEMERCKDGGAGQLRDESIMLRGKITPTDVCMKVRTEERACMH